MCGIAGVFSINHNKVEISTLKNMSSSIAHRGPDGEGFYINPNKNIGFAHRRLAIIDKSDAGNQPMHFLNRYTIIHNGEIYNFKELRNQLESNGYSFKSQTDTEVILAAYDKYKEKCLQLFDGMFAFAIWDEQEQTIFAARDRFGEKPFYYYCDGESFYFASEMKALWKANVPKEINHSLMCLYLGLGYTQTPFASDFTFYKNIYTLNKSNYLILNYTKTDQNFQFKTTQYWDIDKESKTNLTEEQATERFLELLTSSVKSRLISDVPIGSSLSGGLDSSSIASIINKLGVENYKTFSAIFPNYIYNEEKYIELVNEKFNTKANYTKPTIESFIQNFEKLIDIQEQPFISSSVFAQYKVFELAKQNNVTVLLDGQGADETIGGYTKYIHWYLQELFLNNKKLFKVELNNFKNNNLQWGFANYFASWFPAAAAARLEKKATNQLVWQNNLEQSYLKNYFTKLLIHKPLVKKLNDILYYNTSQFGLQELLQYADKNAMANGVEIRLPFLQHELVQFVFSLPSNYKIKNGYLKNILRNSVTQSLPNEIVWRKEKVGFETPQKDWLNHSYFTEKIVDAKKYLVNLGIMNPNIKTIKTKSEQDWRILIAAEYLK